MLKPLAFASYVMLALSHSTCLGQFASFPSQMRLNDPPGLSVDENRAVSPPASAISDSGQSGTPVSSVYVPGEGLNITMFNESSKLKIFANLSNIVTFSTTRTFPTAGPLFLLPPASTNATNGFDIGARQSNFGVMFTGPDINGFTPGAFFLGYIQNDNLAADAYGLLPFNAYGELKSEDWRFSVGLQSDVFNPIAPTMIALIGLFDSGNTGVFRGQIRLEHFWKPRDDFQLTTQFAISEPTTTIISNNLRIIEDDGIPNLEARLAAGFGEVSELMGGRKMRPLTIGISGLIGRMRNSTLQDISDVPPELVRSVVRVWGVGADVQAAVMDRFGFSGEVFLGQSLGEYNGMIGQVFGELLHPIRGAGGWGEVYCYLSDCVHVHAGYGLDAPVVRDLGPNQIARNQTYFANIFWDVTKQLQLSFQVDYRQTDFVTFRDAEGFVFLSQLLFRF